MAEVVIHLGLDETARSVLHAWFGEHHEEVAADHGLVVQRVTPAQDPLEAPSRGGAPFRGRFVGVSPVRAGEVDSSILRWNVARALADGDHSLADRIHDRFASEVLDAAADHGRVLFLGAGFAKGLAARDPGLVVALRRISERAHLRLLGHVRPQHEALESIWRRKGCSTGRPPSLYLGVFAQLLEVAPWLEWLRDAVPRADLQLAPAVTDRLTGGTVPRDLLERLGIDHRDPPVAGWDPMLPLEVANLASGPAGQTLWEDLPSGDVIDEIRHEVGDGSPPSDWSDDELLESRRRLRDWCRRRFASTNEALDRLFDWRLGDLVDAAAGPVTGDPTDGADNLRWLNAAWTSAVSPTERSRRFGRWRTAADTVDPTAEQCQTARLLDLGCGAGDTLRSAMLRFGVEGIGFDLTRWKIRAGQAQGLPVFSGDAFALDPADFPAVDYVVLDNVLEHLEDAEVAARMLTLACRLAGRAVFVRHPSFERMEELAGLGCKIYWTDWPGNHTNPLAVAALEELAVEAGALEVHRVDVDAIRDSDHAAVVPVGAPSGLTRLPGSEGAYDSRWHGPKPEVAFDPPLYGAHDLLIRTGPGRLTMVYPDDPAGVQQRPAVRWEAGDGPIRVAVESRSEQASALAASGLEG